MAARNPHIDPTHIDPDGDLSRTGDIGLRLLIEHWRREAFGNRVVLDGVEDEAAFSAMEQCLREGVRRRLPEMVESLAHAYVAAERVDDAVRVVEEEAARPAGEQLWVWLARAVPGSSVELQAELLARAEGTGEDGLEITKAQFAAQIARDAWDHDEQKSTLGPEQKAQILRDIEAGIAYRREAVRDASLAGDDVGRAITGLQADLWNEAIATAERLGALEEEERYIYESVINLTADPDHQEGAAASPIGWQERALDRWGKILERRYGTAGARQHLAMEVATGNDLALLVLGRMELDRSIELAAERAPLSEVEAGLRQARDLHQKAIDAGVPGSASAWPLLLSEALSRGRMAPITSLEGDIEGRSPADWAVVEAQRSIMAAIESGVDQRDLYLVGSMLEDVAPDVARSLLEVHEHLDGASALSARSEERATRERVAGWPEDEIEARCVQEVAAFDAFEPHKSVPIYDAAIERAQDGPSDVVERLRERMWSAMVAAARSGDGGSIAEMAAQVRSETSGRILSSPAIGALARLLPDMPQMASEHPERAPKLVGLLKDYQKLLPVHAARSTLFGEADAEPRVASEEDVQRCIEVVMDAALAAAPASLGLRQQLLLHLAEGNDDRKIEALATETLPLARTSQERRDLLVTVARAQAAQGRIEESDATFLAAGPGARSQWVAMMRQRGVTFPAPLPPEEWGLGGPEDGLGGPEGGIGGPGGRPPRAPGGLDDLIASGRRRGPRRVDIAKRGDQGPVGRGSSAEGPEPSDEASQTSRGATDAAKPQNGSRGAARRPRGFRPNGPGSDCFGSGL